MENRRKRYLNRKVQEEILEISLFYYNLASKQFKNPTNGSFIVPNDKKIEFAMYIKLENMIISLDRWIHYYERRKPHDNDVSYPSLGSSDQKVG